MRKLLASAAVLAVMAPVAGSSETFDGLQIQMAGQVEDVCTVQFTNDPANPNLVEGLSNPVFGNFDQAGDTVQFSAQLEILNSNDPSDASIGDISEFEAEIEADFFCNGDYEATVTAAQGKFTNDDLVTNADDFSNQFSYDAEITFDDDAETDNPDINLDINPGALTETSSGSQHNGVITITISGSQSNVLNAADETASGLNLIAGVYEEAITFSFVQDGLIPAADFSVAAPDVVSTFVGGAG